MKCFMMMPLPPQRAGTDLDRTGLWAGRKEHLCAAFPYHSCEAYIARLVKKGYKVAICEQMGESALAKERCQAGGCPRLLRPELCD